MLAPLAGDYDYVFLDCPPSISLVSESVFEAADALLVPLIPATLSSRTFEQLARVVADGRAPQVLAFFSMVDGRKRLHREVMEQLTAEHPERAADRDPGRRRRRADGRATRAAIAEFAPRGRAAQAYEALWREIRERLESGRLRDVTP